MTGVTGGTRTGTELSRMLDSLHREPWYESATLEEGGLGVAVLDHGERDPAGCTVWRGDGRAGVVYGSITTLEELELDVEEMFDRLFDDPVRTAKALDGPFLLVGVDADADRLLVVTDKLGSRPCFYTEDPTFLFGTSVAPILTQLDDVEVDEQGVTDMLMMGHMWGETTLVEGVRSLRPARVLTYDGGDVSVERYWRPSYDLAPAGDAYIHELATRFQRSVDRLSTTLHGTTGLWLSGGLDSRMTAPELLRNSRKRGFDLRTYTYDTNPPGGINPVLAGRVSETLGVDNELVPVDPDAFASALDTAVLQTDGMVQWHSLLNLASVYNVERPPNVMMEGVEGSLIGHHLKPYHFRCSTAVESMYRSEAKRDLDTVTRIYTGDVDPLDSFRAEANQSQERTLADTILDAHLQNYYPRFALMSNKVPRSLVGTRVPYVDGDFLAHAARLPMAYREKTVPFTNHRIPFGVPKSKLLLMRMISTELSAIPYEKTRLPPSYPFAAHVAGFIGTTAWGNLRKKETYGGPGVADGWYRTNEALNERVSSLLEAAGDRPFFDGDVIRELQDEHLRGESHNIGCIAPITTIELWLQQSLDGPHGGKRVPSMTSER